MGHLAAAGIAQFENERRGSEQAAVARKEPPLLPLKHIARCVWRESFTDRTFMVAAGVAFFALFSLLPALAVIGIVLAWIGSAEVVEVRLNQTRALLPEGTPQLFAEFLLSVPTSLTAGLGLSVNLVVVFWTVQRAASGLITALNVVYDEDEKRSRLNRELVAIAIAAAGLLLLFLALFFALVVPAAGAAAGSAGQVLLAARWPFLIAALMVGLSLLYAFAPARKVHNWRSIMTGAGVATVLWLIASVLFALYMNAAGGWDRFYGSVTAAVVLMTWMFIGAFVMMVGAEVDAQIEALRRSDKRKSRNKDMLDRREQTGGRGAGS